MSNEKVIDTYSSHFGSPPSAIHTGPTLSGGYSCEAHGEEGAVRIQWKDDTMSTTIRSVEEGLVAHWDEFPGRQWGVQALAKPLALMGRYILDNQEPTSDDDNLEEVLSNMSELRQERGLSVAAAAKEAGVSAQTWSRIEKDPSRGSEESREAIYLVLTGA